MTPQNSALNGLAEDEVSTIIAMAWQDDTPFEAIAAQFGLQEQAVIELMRSALKARSFRVWRMRVRGRVAKHQHLQTRAQRERSSSGSSEAINQALSDAQEPFPLPPSALSRESLR